jgi:hypothetical protein
VDLPVTFARPVRLLAYIPGHSQVLLRGEPDSEAGRPSTLEILFTDVGALAVRDHYRSLTLRLASGAEEARLRSADPRPWYDWRAFLLETEPGDGGHVVAGGVFWAESPDPVGYRSLLAPSYDLPRFPPDRPSPGDPGTIFTARRE